MMHRWCPKGIQSFSLSVPQLIVETHNHCNTHVFLFLFFTKSKLRQCKSTAELRWFRRKEDCRITYRVFDTWRVSHLPVVGGVLVAVLVVAAWLLSHDGIEWMDWSQKSHWDYLPASILGGELAVIVLSAATWTLQVMNKALLLEMKEALTYRHDVVEYWVLEWYEDKRSWGVK